MVFVHVRFRTAVRAISCALAFVLAATPVFAMASEASAAEAIVVPRPSAAPPAPEPLPATIPAAVATPTASLSATSFASPANLPAGSHEIVSRRDRFAEHYALPDGRKVAFVSGAPIHYKTDDAWVDIDTRMVLAAPDTYVNAANDFRLSTGPEGTTEPVTVSKDDWRVSLDLLGSTEQAPLVAGSRSTYIGADTSLAYDSGPTGVKETIYVSSPAADTDYTFRVETTGCALVDDGAGGYAIKRYGLAQTVGGLAPLVVRDSATPTQAVCASATMQVTPLADGAFVTYHVPQEWLADPARVFPVAIDPGICLVNPEDTFAYAKQPTYSYWNNTRLKVGNNTASTLEWFRSFLRFPLTGLYGKDISAAQLSLWYCNWGASAGTCNVEKLSTSWNHTTLTWNNQPSFASNTLVTSQYLSGTTAHWDAFDITSAAQQWALGSDATNYGLRLRTPETTAYFNHYFEFYSAEDLAYQYGPRIGVTYTDPSSNASCCATYRGGDTVIVTMTVNTAHPDNVREMRLLPNYTSGDVSRYRGYFAWFSYDPGAGWTTTAAPDGGYFAYYSGSSDFGQDHTAPLVGSWTTSQTTTSKTVAFALRVDDGWSDVADTDMDTYIQMGTPALGTFNSGWVNQNTNVNVLPTPLAGLTTTVTPTTEWFKQADSNGDGIGDTPNDFAGQGRGDVSLSWARSAGATGYHLYLFDGGQYRKVGQMIGSHSTTWSSDAAAFYPKDSEIASWPAEWAGNPFYRAQSPAASTLETAVSMPTTITGAGVVVTNHSYLYVRRWSNYGGPSQWAKIGSGLGGTVRGYNYGSVGPDFAGKDILSAFYLDGSIYNGYADTSRTITGVTIDGATSSLSFSEPLLLRDSAVEVTSATGAVALASDGTHVYSMAYSRSGAGYDGWMIREYAGDGTFVADHPVGTSSYYTDGIIADGSNIYLLEWGGSGRVTKVSTADWRITGQWQAGWSATRDINGCFDSANNVFWVGALDQGYVRRYAGPGVGLRDNPNPLYKKTDGASFDAATNYSFRVVPYTDGNGDLPDSESVLTEPTLENRTVGVGTEPRHTVYDFGTAGGHAMQSLLDTGSLELSIADLRISSFGPSAALTRHYGSKDTSSVRFSSGWRFGFERSLEISETAVSYLDEVGEAHRFTRVGDACFAPVGTTDRLIQEAGGWRLINKDRSSECFDANGRLTADSDKVGNSVTYVRDGGGGLTITAANGQSIAVAFDAGGKIKQAKYTTGTSERVVSYDASSGRVDYNPGQAGSHSVLYSYDASGTLSALSVPDYPKAGQNAAWAFAYSGGVLSQVRYPGSDSDAYRRIDLVRGPSSSRAATVTAFGDVGGSADVTITRTFTWNPTGTMASASDPATGTASQLWKYTYDPIDECVSERSPSGKSVGRQFDVRGNMLWDWDEDGHRTAYIYDSLDQLLRSTDPRGCTSTYEYYTNCYEGTGQLKSEVRVLSAVDHSRTEYVYRNAGDFGAGLLTSKSARISANETATTTYGYDALGRANQETAPGVLLSIAPTVTADLFTRAAYDEFGNAVRRWDAAGTLVTSSTYDAAGRVTESSDASGVVTHSRYDTLGDVTESWTSAPGTSTKAAWSLSEFDGEGRLATATALLSNTGQSDVVTQSVATHVRDALGRETSATSSVTGGRPGAAQYDARGNVTRSWASGVSDYSLSRSTRADYDEYGRLWRQYDSGSDASCTVLTYNANGTIKRATFSDGSWTQYVYDDGGNRISATYSRDGGTAVSTWAYDIGGRSIEATSPDGARTGAVYDSAGRVVASSGDTTPSTSVYNALGWVLRSSDPAGITISRTYDAAGRVVTEKRLSGSTVKSTTSTYSPAGQLLSQTDPDDNTLVFQYDEFGRQSSQQMLSRGTQTKRSDSVFDSLGRIVATHDTGGIDRAFAYPLNQPGQTVAVASYGGVTTTVTVGADGKELSRAASSAGLTIASRTPAGYDTADREIQAGFVGTGIQATYDQSGRLTRSWGAGYASYAASITAYGYDSSGRRSSEDLRLALGGTISASYVYTPAGRLSVATIGGVATRYAFAASGNLMGIKRGSEASRTLSYNTAGRLSTSTVESLTQPTLYRYDELGQRITQGPASSPATLTYAYTGSGRLERYETSASVKAVYAHDASGQRTRSVVTSGSLTTTTTWLADGDSLLALTAQRSDNAAWGLTYLRDASDDPYAGVYRGSDASAAVTFALVTAERGDVVELLDSAGAPFAAYRYDAFGLPTSVTTTGTASIPASLAASIASRQPLRYSGYVLDPESGLYALGARSYDPLTAQFLTCDPARADGEESPYQYCGGDPIGKTDPSGLIAIWGDEGRVTAFDSAVNAYTHTKNGTLLARYWKRVVDEGSRERARWRKIEVQREKARRERQEAAARAAAQARDRRRAAESAGRFEVVDTPLFGTPGNHVYVRDTHGTWKMGTNAADGVDPRMTFWMGPVGMLYLYSRRISIGDGGGPVDGRRPFNLPDGMSPEEFKQRINDYPGWNKGKYCFFVNDCFTQLQGAFEYAGVPYPGTPNGRVDQQDSPQASDYSGMYGARR